MISDLTSEAGSLLTMLKSRPQAAPVGSQGGIACALCGNPLATQPWKWGPLTSPPQIGGNDSG